MLSKHSRVTYQVDQMDPGLQHLQVILLDPVAQPDQLVQEVQTNQMGLVVQQLLSVPGDQLALEIPHLLKAQAVQKGQAVLAILCHQNHLSVLPGH